MSRLDFTGMLREARKVNSTYAVAAFGVIAVIAIVILLLGKLKITTFDAFQTLFLIGMLLFTLIVLVRYGPRENQLVMPPEVVPSVPSNTIKPIGNPKQGKFGILIDLSHEQGEWNRDKGSIFKLIEPERQLISLIHPPEKGQISWNIQEIKDSDQYNSEDFANWWGLIFGIPHNKKISQNVCNAIVKWVHQGGRLILLGYELGDRHHGANLNQLAQKFGLWFNSDIVGPERVDRPIKPYHRPIEFNDLDSTQHSILNGVKNLIFRDTCTLSVEAGSSIILTVGNKSLWKWLNPVFDKDGKSSTGEPQKYDIINQASWVPIIAEAPHSLTGKGRVLAIGTWNFFDTAEYLKNVDNYRFVCNLVEWLIQRESSMPKNPPARPPSPSESEIGTGGHFL